MNSQQILNKKCGVIIDAKGRQLLRICLEAIDIINVKDGFKKIYKGVFYNDT